MNPELNALPVRAVTVLHRLGLETKADAAHAIQIGVLQVGTHGPLGYGIVTHRAVCKWAGVPIVDSKSVAEALADIAHVFPRGHGYEVTHYHFTVRDRAGKHHILRWPNRRACG